MPRESAVMGLGAPKSDQLCPPGPVMAIALRGDVFGGGAVHRNYCCEARAVTFDESANAAEVAFAFFADITCEDDRFSGLDARFGKCAREAC
jgi:hypothetical protein